jgi:hypothetical protein
VTVIGKDAAIVSSSAAAIQAFWSWWSTARPRIEQAVTTGPDPELIDDISTHVNAIHGRLAWELGAGQRSRHYLCLTPEGNPELRPLTERWVRAAPPPDAVWEYHPARPASLGALHATLELEGRRLDPGQARLHLAVDEDRQVIDVGVHHPAMRKLRERARGTLAFLLLDWLLGEDGVERWVGAIEVHVKEPKGTVAAEALPEIVQALAERHPEPTWALLQGVDDGGRPMLVVTRRPLKRIDWPSFDLHGRLTVARTGTDRDPDTRDLVEQLEDLLGAQAVLAARETHHDHQSHHLYCDGDGPVPDLVESWRSAQRLPMTVVWERDPAWTAVRQFQ